MEAIFISGLHPAKPRLGEMVQTAVTETDFENLYHEHMPRIYNFFRFRLGEGPPGF